MIHINAYFTINCPIKPLIIKPLYAILLKILKQIMINWNNACMPTIISSMVQVVLKGPDIMAVMSNGLHYLSRQLPTSQKVHWYYLWYIYWLNEKHPRTSSCSNLFEYWNSCVLKFLSCAFRNLAFTIFLFFVGGVVYVGIICVSGILIWNKSDAGLGMLSMGRSMLV